MGGIRKGIWIARDQNGGLYAYRGKKPYVYVDPNTKIREFFGGYHTMKLPSNWCKHIKFENSPVFIPLPEDFIKQFIKK